MDWFTINQKLMRYLAGVAAEAYSGQAVSARFASLIFRPVQADDVDLILEMHQRSSEKTIFSRYHSPRVPTRQEIAQICQLNGENGRAIVAAIGGKKPAVVGLGYYILSTPETAELALMIEDSYQGQGIGKRLLHQLTELAVTQGVCFFDAYVLPSNKPMIHLLHQTGLVVQNKLDYGTREVRVKLTAVSPWVFADAWSLPAVPEHMTV